MPGSAALRAGINVSTGAGSESNQPAHLAEALQFRSMMITME
jgi:hypothetical protein